MEVDLGLIWQSPFHPIYSVEPPVKCDTNVCARGESEPFNSTQQRKLCGFALKLLVVQPFPPPSQKRWRFSIWMPSSVPSQKIRHLEQGDCPGQCVRFVPPERAKQCHAPVPTRRPPSSLTRYCVKLPRPDMPV